MFHDDLTIFAMDFKAIRKIWYNTEPLVDGSDRTELLKCSQLAAYIMSHPYLANTTKECNCNFNQFAITKKEVHKTEDDTIIFGTQGGKRHPWLWLSKMICNMGPFSCRKFVNKVESGLTVYDWPAWILGQTLGDNFEKGWKEFGLIFQDENNKRNNPDNCILTKKEYESLNRICHRHKKALTAPQERDAFLPLLSIGKIKLPDPAEHVNKKRRT